MEKICLEKVNKWIKAISTEYKYFKERMLIERDKINIFGEYEKIMLYTTVYNYLISTEDDVYLDLTIKDVYDYYIENDIYDIALTDNDQLIKLLDWTYEDKERKNYYMKYEKEFESLKKTLMKENSETIFNDYERIRFYNIIYNYIQNKEYCYVKKYIKERTIEELWNKYNESKEHISVNNTTLLESFLDDIK